LRGGANGDSEIFKITAAGVLTVLHSFDVTDGYEPNDSLLQATDGNFYGTTTYGGTGEEGTVFEINSAGKLSTIYDFTGGLTDGSTPFGGLVQHTSGAFYGVTGGGGTGELGTIFTFGTGLSPFVKLLPASGKVGSTVTILGTNLTGIKSVTFNGIAATWTKGTNTYFTAVVPTGATTGLVEVTTSCCTLKSNVSFRIP
jgi:uncharacterized repeat protein (TIGR03803 family)